MRLELSFVTTLVLSSLAAAQTPLVSSRQYLAGDTVLASSMGNQQAPAIARGGTSFLIAWSDGRAAMQGGDDHVESSHDIWFQRLGLQGELLSPTPTPVAASPARDVLPVVTWNGSTWLVTWLVQPFGASNTFSEVLGVRIAANGAVLDAQPLTLFTGTLMWHAAASDGQGWVVVARTQSSGIRARLVSAAPQNPVGAAVTLSSDPALSGDISSTQGAYLLTWSWLGSTGTVDLLGQRFYADLNPIDSSPFSIAASPVNDENPVVATNGSEYLVAWDEFNNNSFSGLLRCARVSTTAVVSPQQPVTSGITGGWYASGLAWDGAQWFVCFGGQRMARVSAAGQVLDFNGFFVRPADGVGRSSLTAAGPSAAGVCAAWSATTPTILLTGEPRYEVRSTIVASPSSLGTDAFPPASAPSQAMPALAAHAAGSAVLFRSETAGLTRLMLSRLDPQGVALDAQPVQVSSGKDIRNPSLAWDGTRYIAAWIHGPLTPGFSSIRARRIGVDGTLLDPADIQLATAASGAWPSVDAAGRNGEFVVAGVRGADLALWRIRGLDGVMLSGPTVVIGGAVRKVSLCATPSGYAASWFSWTLGPTGEIGAALISAAGVVSPPFVTIGSNRAFGTVSLASSGNELLLAWDEDVAGVRTIDAQRFDLAGAALDPTPFAVAPTAEEFDAELTWDGTNYVCAYQELDGTAPNSGVESDVRAARISSAGVVIDAQGFDIDSDTVSEGQPAVVGLGGGRSRIASSVLRTESPFAAYRISTRTVSDGCPAPTTFCTAKTNSQQCLPTIAISAAPSASGANGCFVTATNVLDNTNGLMLFGYQAAAIPFQGGFLCIAPPRHRTLIQNAGAGGSGSPCAGQFAFDFGIYVLSGADPVLQVPGQTFACQYWSRDPADPFGSSFTNAVHGQICW